MRDTSLGGATAREISYAHSARSLAGRAFIRSVENITGRPRLIRMALGYDLEVDAGRDFWEVMAERYRLRTSVTEADLARIPRDGPLVAVANHPFGILDGLALGLILSRARGDFKIMAHKVFHKARDLERVILPLNWDETPEGVRQNLRTRQDALSLLAGGGCVGVFPGGAVSTSRTLRGRPMDPAWKTFTAKMIFRSRARVVPIHFDGGNSRLFQIASHLNGNLRRALLIAEFDRSVRREVNVTIGEPLPQAELDRHRGDARGLMAHLRLATYRLAPTPLEDYAPGLEVS